MSDCEKQIADFGKDDDFWLFGYGSLIWKPPPHYDQRVPGYIEGYVRRFWQASEDHRGTPEAPGRVATLISHAHWETLTDHHESTERVWGAAYHIPTAKVPEVREYLDIREINGYSIQFTPFHPAPFTTTISSPTVSPSSGPADAARAITASTTIHAQPDSQSPPINCLVYIGLPENPQFLGPQDPGRLAAHILQSRGPSGENREYLFGLEKALLDLSVESEDAHISDLVKRCKKIESRHAEEVATEGSTEEAPGDGPVAGSIGVPLHKVGSTDEQEEVEG